MSKRKVFKKEGKRTKKGNSRCNTDRQAEKETNVNRGFCNVKNKSQPSENINCKDCKLWRSIPKSFTKQKVRKIRVCVCRSQNIGDEIFNLTENDFCKIEKKINRVQSISKKFFSKYNQPCLVCQTIPYVKDQYLKFTSFSEFVIFIYYLFSKKNLVGYEKENIKFQENLEFFKKYLFAVKRKSEFFVVICKLCFVQKMHQSNGLQNIIQLLSQKFPENCVFEDILIVASEIYQDKKENEQINENSQNKKEYENIKENFILENNSEELVEKNLQYNLEVKNTMKDLPFDDKNLRKNRDVAIQNIKNNLLNQSYYSQIGTVSFQNVAHNFIGIFGIEAFCKYMEIVNNSLLLDLNMMR